MRSSLLVEGVASGTGVGGVGAVPVVGAIGAVPGVGGVGVGLSIKLLSAATSGKGSSGF